MFKTTLMNLSKYKLIILLTVLIVNTSADESADIDYSFPDGFLIGVATSSYQTEGAWNDSGKSENVWDHFTHNHPEKIADRKNADITCDFYNKYKEDIKLLKDIGVNHFRFSLSWSRILPTGYADSVNEEGLRYYHNILDELEKHGIEPFVTLYHWDHPQSLERLGGWMNDLMADLFADYAKIVFKEFGHRVKFFTTLNEPFIFCRQAYEFAECAPGLKLSGWGQYVCMHNMLKAHAIAYHIYDDEFRSKHNGQIGVTEGCFHHYSKDIKDFESSDIAFEFQCGWFSNPIFSEEGDYPEIMKRIIREKSKLEGRRRSKLPTLSKEWIQYIKGTADYFGVNHYTSIMVEPLANATSDQETFYQTESGLSYKFHEEWPATQSSLFKVVPQGLRDTLRKIKDKYNNPPVYILENGLPDANIKNDTLRIEYHYSYIKEMLIAMKRDKCNVKAYTVWSLMDNFEWMGGYTINFGLVSVDFNDPNRTRTPKKSASWLKSVIKSRKLQPVQ